MKLLFFLSPFLILPGLSAAVCVNTSNCTFDLDSTEVAAFNSSPGSPFGTVNLALTATNTIIITVDLLDGYGFNIVDTGSHEAFTFNNNLGGAAVTMSSFSNAIYSAVAGSPGTNAPFGTFMNGVQSTCTNGSGCGINAISFTVSTGSGGFTDVNQLVKLSTGGSPNAFFAADIANGNGATVS